jgi:DNA-binding Lrp family transcriptional regulator
MKLELVKKIEREIIKLDPIDEAILGVLSYNARLSESKIAKILQTSKQNINYRLKKLKEYGIYHGARAIINRKLLNLQKVHYFTQTPINNKHPLINAHLEFSGFYTQEVALIAPTLEEIRTVSAEFEKSAKECISKECIIIQTIKNNPFPVIAIHTEQLKGEAFEGDFAQYRQSQHKQTQHKQLQNHTKTNNNAQSKLAASHKIELASLDATDLELIRILSINANKSLTELGKKFDITHDAIRFRIRRLIKQGVILGFTPAISYEKLGFMMTCVLVLHPYPKDFSKLYDKNVIWAALCEDSTIIYYLHYTIAELNEFVKDISYPYHIMPYVTRHKYRYMSDLRVMNIVEK